jgi:hypothetical protein
MTFLGPFLEHHMPEAMSWEQELPDKISHWQVGTLEISNLHEINKGKIIVFAFAIISRQGDMPFCEELSSRNLWNYGNIFNIIT